MSEASLRPPLKWAGGKRWLVPHLRPLWEPYAAAHRLVEPFAGGLAVTFGLRPLRALCNDINPHLVNFFFQVQRGLSITIPMENDEALYYAHRAAFNELVAEGRARTPAAAGLFYYLNRTGYNGLCRFNRRGLFNVPFGRYRAIAYVRDFSGYVPALSSWTFMSADFEALDIQPGDFVYADPPYDVEFTSYARESFGWPDQVRLAGWLARLHVPVILSNQATARIVDLYASLGFRLTFLEAPRQISCTGDRAPAREVLATRNITPP